MGTLPSKSQIRKLRKKKSTQSTDSKLSYDETGSECGFGTNYMINGSNDEFSKFRSYNYLTNSIWQSPFSAPVEDCLLSNSKILDIGNASRPWILDMAEKYPNSTFYGLELNTDNTDLPSTVPKNVTFFKADILSLPFEDEEFNYSRFGDVMALFSDIEWEQLLSEIIRVTKCGGWIEISELDLTASKTAPNYFRIVEAFMEASALKGRNPKIISKMGYLMHLTKQLIDIKDDYKNLLLGPKSGGVGMIAVDNLITFYRDYVGESIADHLNLSWKDYNLMLEAAEEEMKNNNVFIRYYRFWAQKSNTANDIDLIFSYHNITGSTNNNNSFYKFQYS